MKRAMQTAVDIELKTRLHKAGLKATKPRMILLHTLQKTRKPLSISDIHTTVGVRLVNLATVYRAMQDFHKKGIVIRIDTGHAHAHFELPTTHHHHIVCRVCGVTEDILSCPVTSVDKRTLRRSKQFASMDGHTLEFFGLCTSCDST